MSKNISYDVSERELEVLELISKGFTNHKIAELLILSHHTVESHRKNLLKKLNVKNSAELIKVAVKSNLIK